MAGSSRKKGKGPRLAALCHAVGPAATPDTSNRVQAGYKPRLGPRPETHHLKCQDAVRNIFVEALLTVCGKSTP